MTSPTNASDDSEGDALGRRRNSWDYVRETQRRGRVAAEADWRQRTETAPNRPTDTWRICGKPVVVPDDPDQRSRGCSCNGYELFNDKTMIAVLARLNGSTDHDNPSSPPRVR